MLKEITKTKQKIKKMLLIQLKLLLEIFYNGMLVVKPNTTLSSYG